jgi:NAD(P)-dependent dehydrogenase (short-subunit alcohol dehydrogenase family)
MPADVGTVLVTGGASGLGAAITAAVAAGGGTPLVLDLQPPRGGAVYEQVDLAVPRAAETATLELLRRCGDGLDAVVTAAGVDHPGAFGDVAGDAWDRIVAVNLLGTAAVIRAALPALRARRGRIVTVASTLGFRALPDATAYCASKFGVVGFSRALAAELAGEVGVTLMVPGGMRTAFFEGREERYRPGADALLNDPADVAAAVMFALAQPHGCELRELVLVPATETSWPP